jgi:cytidyltransferase-like protein
MDPVDKAVLASLYASSLDPSIPAYDRLKARLPLSKEFYNSRVSHLAKLGLVEKSDPSKLTFIGRDALKVVLVGGVFDLIHPGHIHTLKAAKTEGDVLVVVVATQSTAQKIKKDRKIYHDEGLRKELVA